MPLYSDYPDDKPTLTSYNHSEDESKILKLWAEYEAKPFPDELYYCERREGIKSFVWGPPFPTGAPHSGHILNAVLKDVLLRYGHQKFPEVKSTFRWDCHGLPVEHEVDKKLGIKCLDDIHKMGVSAYNAECRKFVLRNETEWKKVFKRIAIRADFSDSCSSMTPQSMERVWGAFQRLYEKGLVYRDTKVLPFSTGCFTHLSDFEAEQKLTEVSDLCITIALDIIDSNDKLLVWIVDPWKLVGVAAICLNRTARYVKVKVLSSGSIYIVSKNRLTFTFPNSSDYKVLAEFEGGKLKDSLCLGPSELFQDELRLRILTDESISDDVGTGIVALSPYFGAEDYRICKENGVKIAEHNCPIDDSGRFKKCISEIRGLSVCEASAAIVESLRRREYLFNVENRKLKRRHCWRSDTPLIEKLVSTYFVRTTVLSEKILENSAEVNWVGHDVHRVFKDSIGKFNDWPVGRSRFWGTPVPIWSSPTGEEVVCVGSIKELIELTGLSSVSDLHREFIDDLEIESKGPGNPPLRRVTDVFDCWFEASVLSQGNEEHQADGMIEGSDQYYGWFYTTTALSAAFSQPALAKNVLVHGLVETSKGEKISKRLHNYSDPLRLVKKYGADAFRLYLLTTPLVGGGDFALRAKYVPEMASRIFPPLYKILKDILPRFGKRGMIYYGLISTTDSNCNILDRWILSKTERLVRCYDTGLTAYQPQELVAKIAEHIELVENVYLPIRQGTSKHKNDGWITSVLYDILLKTIIILSPFAPFFTEHVFQIMKPWVSYYQRELMYKVPLTDEAKGLLWKEEEKVESWIKVIELVRELRREHLIPIEYRINELIVISPTDISFKNKYFINKAVSNFINVYKISMTNERNTFGVELKADLRGDSSLHQELCPTEAEEIVSRIHDLNDDEVEELIKNRSLTVKDKIIPLSDTRISCKFNKSVDRKEGIKSQNEIAVIIRMSKNLEYYEEGTYLALVNAVKKFKRKCKLYPSEDVTICYATKDECMQYAFEKFADHLQKSTNSIVKPLDNDARNREGSIQMQVNIKGVPVELCLYKESTL